MAHNITSPLSPCEGMIKDLSLDTLQLCERDGEYGSSLLGVIGHRWIGIEMNRCIAPLMRSTWDACSVWCGCLGLRAVPVLCPRAELSRAEPSRADPGNRSTGLLGWRDGWCACACAEYPSAFAAATDVLFCRERGAFVPKIRIRARNERAQANGRL